MLNGTRFVLVSPARSGSTVLRNTLNAHPEVICHGEILDRNRILGLVHNPAVTLSGIELYQLRKECIKDFVYSQILVAPSAVKAVGFKALYYHFGEIQFAEAIQMLIECKDIKMIFLWRRNLVDRYLSEVQHRMEAALKTKPVTVTLEEVAQDCRNQLSSGAIIGSMLSDHTCITVCYEDLVSDSRTTLQRITALLGVDPGIIELPEKRESPADTQNRNLIQRLAGKLVGADTHTPGRCKRRYLLIENEQLVREAAELDCYRNHEPPAAWNRKPVTT